MLSALGEEGSGVLHLLEFGKPGDAVFGFVLQIQEERGGGALSLRASSSSRCRTP